MSNIDPSILATLTDEERAAIAGDDLTPEEKAAMEEIAGEADDDDADDDGTDDVDDGDDDDVDAGDPPADAKPEAQAPAVAAEPEPSEKPAPQQQQAYRADLPANFSEQVEALKSKTEQLAESYKTGEIDFDEYRAQSAELQKESAVLERALTKAEIAKEIAEQSAHSEWQANVQRIFAQAAKDDGIDYATDAVKNQDLDTFIKALAANPANHQQPMGWFVDEAHKRVLALHGISKAPAANQTKTDKPNRKPPTDAIPKTLAQVPGGDGPGDVAGEFANIDSLDGEALEAAIQRMTPAQRERYMAGA